MTQKSQKGRKMMKQLGIKKRQETRPLTKIEKRKIKSIMAQVSIREAAARANLYPDVYFNVMADRSKNMTDFNKIVAEAKKMIAVQERQAV